MSKPEWMPFYVGDFLASKNVGRMSAAARGVYILLLCVAWHEEPQGSLPDDDEALADFGRVKAKEWQQVKPSVLRAFERKDDGRWYQSFMVKEAARSAAIIEKRRKAGRASGASRSTHVEQVLNTCMNTTATAADSPVAVVVPVPVLSSVLDSDARGKIEADPVPVDRVRIISALTGAGFAPQQAIKFAGQPGATVERVEHFIEKAGEPGVGDPIAFIKSAIREAWPVERFAGPRLVKDDGASDRGFEDAMARIEAAKAKKGKP